MINRKQDTRRGKYRGCGFGLVSPGDGGALPGAWEPSGTTGADGRPRLGDLGRLRGRGSGVPFRTRTGEKMGASVGLGGWVWPLGIRGVEDGSDSEVGRGRWLPCNGICEDVSQGQRRVASCPRPTTSLHSFTTSGWSSNWVQQPG